MVTSSVRPGDNAPIAGGAASVRAIDPGSGVASVRDPRGRVDVSREQLADFCRRHHIRRLSLFGSILRDNFRPDGDQPSDVDVLVEFEPGHTPGWEIVDIEQALSGLFGGRKVDLVN